jgi:excisionase family DNA binding protein
MAKSRLDTPEFGPGEAAERPSVLTIEEAAQLMRIGRNSAYEAARRGEIPTIRIGRRLLVPRAALERMLERAGIPHQDGDGAHGR